MCLSARGGDGINLNPVEFPFFAADYWFSWGLIPVGWNVLFMRFCWVGLDI